MARNRKFDDRVESAPSAAPLRREYVAEWYPTTRLDSAMSERGAEGWELVTAVAEDGWSYGQLTSGYRLFWERVVPEGVVSP